MALVAQGDSAAFRELFERYRVPIYSYLYSMTHDRQIAEDLAQEAFLRVYRSRESYQQEARFTTWLWTIARNIAIDHLRKKKESRLPEDWEETTMGDPRGGVPTDAETLLLEKATQQAVDDCLERLPESQKEALSLRLFGELGNEEISQTMNSTIPAVKSVLHRGRVSLVDCLKRKHYG